jgi:hypothetical protein
MASFKPLLERVIEIPRRAQSPSINGTVFAAAVFNIHSQRRLHPMKLSVSCTTNDEKGLQMISVSLEVAQEDACAGVHLDLPRRLARLFELMQESVSDFKENGGDWQETNDRPAVLPLVPPIDVVA